MRNKYRLALAAVVALALSLPAIAESPSILLEKAIYTEETVGDLDAAIKLYQEIIDESEAARPAVAEAYYRLGMCLLKKGDQTSAAQAFRAILADFPQEKGLARSAQDALAQLGVTTSANPIVIRTNPATFTSDVSPDLTKITVTFDQPMMDGSWSWTGGGDTFPEITGKIHYDAARRTCTFPVKLEPGKVYWVGVNSPSFENFKSAKGVPAWRRVILFATKTAEGRATPLPKKALAQAKAINDAGAPAAIDCRALLDPQTMADVTKMDRDFSAWFQANTAYEAALQNEKEAMVEQWMADAQSRDFKKRTRAIAALGNVAAKDAVDVLIDIAEEPMSNNRPKWMAVRALGRIGDMAGVPTLIELVDHGNWNTRVYAKVSLAEITGVYFGDDKPKWRTWWDERGSDVSESDKKAAENLASEGWRLWRQGNPADAEKMFRKAVVKDPANANSWNGLGWSQMNQGKTANAKVSFEKCLRIEPRHAGALNGLGWVAKGRGETDDAIGYWEKALEAEPSATAALNGLASTYMELKEYDRAAKYYRMWLAVEPENADAKNGLAQSKEKLKQE